MRNDFETNYLQHWGIAKGQKAKNHKYFERVEQNGKYLYFYSQAEYEAWLHRGQRKVEDTKNKLKAAVNKPVFKNTKSNLLNAISRGTQGVTNSIAKAQKTLTKSNAKQVIDRGNKTISSLLNKASNTVSKQTQNLQKSSKAASANIQQRAKKIANNVSKTLQKAGKDTSKAVQKYVSKGESAIKSALSKAGNTKMSAASKKVGSVGAVIVASLLATAAVAAVVAAVKFIKKHVTDETTVTPIDDWHTPTEDDWRKEQEERERREEERRREEEERKRQQELKDEGAGDKFKEDTAKHSDIPAKDEPTTKDEDMAAINAKQKQLEAEVNAIAEEVNAAYDRYLETGDLKDYYKALKLYDEYIAKNEEYEGYWNNCANCTLTYDLRRRGYDVDAPWNNTGTYEDSVFDWYKMDVNKDVDYWEADSPDEPISKSDARAIIRDIETKYPEGSYGHLMICWGTANDQQGGHDCVWSIENGEVIIRDCQTNEICDPEDYITQSWSCDYFRADDKELSDKAYDIAKAEYADAEGNDITKKKQKKKKK